LATFLFKVILFQIVPGHSFQVLANPKNSSLFGGSHKTSESKRVREFSWLIMNILMSVGHRARGEPWAILFTGINVAPEFYIVATQT